MKLDIKANTLIDTVMSEVNEIQNFYHNVPRGTYLDETSPYIQAYRSMHMAERRIDAISDVTGIHSNDLYQMARIARKWYEQNDWQFYLPEEVAERLLRHTAPKITEA